MNGLRWVVWVGGLAALCAGCSTTGDVPVLSCWPQRSNTVVGYVCSSDTVGTVKARARAMQADALVLLTIQEKANPLTPPETVHMIGSTTFAVGGDSRPFETPVITYAAIKWRTEATVMEPK